MVDPEATVIDVRLPGAGVEVAARTHTGRVRRHNEDAFLVDLDLGLAAVADGMGGHAHGEVASREVLAALAAFLRNHVQAFAEATVAEALRYANRRVYEANRRQGYRDGMGMGSTVAGLWFGKAGAICFHIGDSRVYRYRCQRLQQLTRDHSLYQAWLDAGGEGVAPAANILTRSLGSFAEVQPEVTTVDCQPEDLFLLCSDGLTRYWTHERLERFFARVDRGLPRWVDELVEAADAHDGSDNITVILARIGQPV